MSESITLLVLSFNRRNLELLTLVLTQANYQVITISNYLDLEKVLSEHNTIDLGLIDLGKCDRSIWHYCQQLQDANIPFLTFTPQYNRVVEQDSLAYGASSVLVKPLVIKNLLLLIYSLVGKPE